ncbi:MAG: 2-phospho-L-lactate transferase [Pseudomonadota bacterium]
MTGMNVTLIAGGVGGAKMAEGFAALSGVKLTIIGNVADDAEFHGLWVSPDIDTVTYTLAGLINRDQGWGLADEGRRALDMLSTLGEDTWMFLGDKDFGLHIHRTARIKNGDRRSVIATDIASALGVKASIVLPTDDVVQTRVKTPDGWISFQDYFVRLKCAPEVLDVTFDGIEAARPTPEALAAISRADLIVLAPSNPIVSIEPILGIPGIRGAISQATAPRIGVSPLIAGRVVKGPADRMMKTLGHRTDALGVAALYADILDQFLIDHADENLASEIDAMGPRAICADIMMRDRDDKARLAREIIDLSSSRVAQGSAA